MSLLEILEHRRSIRKYTGERIPEETLEMIVKAGLLAPSGRNLQPWELIVVRDKETLEKLSKCRPSGPQMIAQADAAIVVAANTDLTDVWTEDCSNCMAYMHLMADALGVGSVWVQGRLRPSPAGGKAEDVVREVLGLPENYALEAMLSLGMPAEHPAPKTADALTMDKVHYEKF